MHITGRSPNQTHTISQRSLVAKVAQLQLLQVGPFSEHGSHPRVSHTVNAQACALLQEPHQKQQVLVCDITQKQQVSRL
jgi:hypothetical protein